MQITEVCVKLVEEPGEKKLLGFCTITFDDEFVIRDLKIIQGPKGEFVAMPSRKLSDRCPQCRSKNHLRARHCNECGKQLNPNRAGRDERGRAKLHTDIAHPINAKARKQVENSILEAYEEERKRANEPDYQPTRLGADYDDDDSLSGSRRPSRPAPIQREHEQG